MSVKGVREEKCRGAHDEEGEGEEEEKEAEVEQDEEAEEAATEAEEAKVVGSCPFFCALFSSFTALLLWAFLLSALGLPGKRKGEDSLETVSSSYILAAFFRSFSMSLTTGVMARSR